jgi:uncharacterized membrane protein (DUF2068 family)
MTPPAATMPRRAPTLWVIIAIKLLKGALLLALAMGVYSLSDENLPGLFRSVLVFLHIDPEKKFFADLERRIGLITPANVVMVAGGAVFYSLFSLVEGFGLMFRVRWAGWLAIGESAFFVPIEVYELLHRPSLIVLGILALNVFIVCYLFQNRHRLFHHHGARHD